MVASAMAADIGKGVILQDGNHNRRASIRPTAKVLLALPADSFGDVAQQDLLRAAKQANGDARNAMVARLRFSRIEHALLDDARTRLREGLPDVHQAATRAAKRPVYEVRSRTGAAWRGAVVQDANGVFWLVYAARHDLFHKTVADIMKGSGWQPSKLDEQILRNDRVDEDAADRSVRTLAALRSAISDAVSSGRTERFEVAVDDAAVSSTIELGIEHDQPANSVADAGSSGSVLSLIVRINGGNADLRDELIRTCVPYLQPDPALRDQVYGKDSALELVMTVSHARLTQIIGDFASGSAESAVASGVPSPVALHYANKIATTEAYVLGRAVLALCGSWFVPSISERSDLPVCDECERIHPAAQALLDHLREQVAQS